LQILSDLKNNHPQISEVTFDLSGNYFLKQTNNGSLIEMIELLQNNSIGFENLQSEINPSKKGENYISNNSSSFNKSNTIRELI